MEDLMGHPRNVQPNEAHRSRAALDAEQVCMVLDRLGKASEGLMRAPFDPKPHSLAMVPRDSRAGHDLTTTETEPN